MTVAQRTITDLKFLDDVNVTVGAGVDGYAVVWDNDTLKFVLTALSAGVTDHGALTGLSDDDHAGYVLLAGRAGGQTLYGGTAANEDITIHGTSNATRTTSYVLLQPSGGNVGIGTTAPLGKIDVRGSATAAEWLGLFVENGTTPENSAIISTLQNKAISVQGSGAAYFMGRDVTNDIEFIIGTSNLGTTFSGSTTAHDFQLRTDNVTRVTITKTTGLVGIGTSAPATLLHGLLTSAATNAVTNVLTIGHDTSGTATAGFGAGLLFALESSTTAAQSAARIQALWYEATHATRKADLVLTAYDTAEREGLRIRGAGSAAAIGFLGATPAARIAHVADPSGGGTVDAEARTAINSILATLETFGFHATS